MSIYKVTQQDSDRISDFLGISKLENGSYFIENYIHSQTPNQVPWNKGKKTLQTAWNKGKKMPPISNETRAKLSDSLKGKSYEELHGFEKANDMRAQRSNKFKEYRNTFDPWNKGKKCPEISESMRGRIHSPETRKKMSEAKRGKPSPKKGSKISEEQKAKISASLKERNQS